MYDFFVKKKKRNSTILYTQPSVLLFEECNMDISWPATSGTKPLMVAYDWNLSTQDTEAEGLPDIQGQSAPC